MFLSGAPNGGRHILDVFMFLRCRLFLCPVRSPRDEGQNLSRNRTTFSFQSKNKRRCEIIYNCCLLINNNIYKTIYCNLCLPTDFLKFCKTLASLHELETLISFFEILTVTKEKVFHIRIYIMQRNFLMK